jgi:LytS/YehU family sensor histidine kinase
MRFGTRLTVTWAVEESTLNSLVPQLILQPLVENAIRHGIASSRDNSWIEIASKSSNKAVELSVRNSIGAAKPTGIGVGLRNTRARLKYLYSDEATFSFAIDRDQTATATLVLPMLGAQNQPRDDARSQSGRKVADYARPDYR